MFDTRQQYFKVFLFNAQPQDSVSSPPASLSGELGALPPWRGGRGVNLITHLHLMQRLRMSGAVILPHIRFHGLRTKKGFCTLYIVSIRNGGHRSLKRDK